MDDDDELNFQNSTMCHICEKPLHEDRVLDLSHMTGKYIGPAHNACNLIELKVELKCLCFFIMERDMTAIL